MMRNERKGWRMNMRYTFFALFLLLASGVLLMPTALYAAEHAQSKTLYTCPMHPDYVSDKPGSCPICGMNLVKKAVAKEPEAAVKGGSLGVRGIRINPDQQEMIGVATGEVLMRDLLLDVRASARVVLDQELFQAQESYLSSNIITTAYFNPSRQKLLTLGMSESEIDQVKNQHRADKSLLTVGLDQVWVYAVVYENEMDIVRPGQKVALTSVAFPGDTFDGLVTGVASAVDPQSRTVRVRIHVNDKNRRLHPEMSMTADIAVDLGQKLSVPKDAVMDSGKRKIVHVMTGAETFTPHDVVLGQEASGFYEVKSGLQEGDKVVVSGNFLVDAESQLKGSYDRKDN